jgi:magnesium chelatase family protein
MAQPPARIHCRGQIGLYAPLVHVEVSVADGLPAFSIVGLPATVVKESKDRVRAALVNSNFEFPAGRITVSLAPADLPKEGGRFDLPIALGILIASGQIQPASSEADGVGARSEFYGELGLSGDLLPTRGLLLAAAHASCNGHELIVPRASAQEALLVARTPVRAATHLREVCAHLEGREPLEPLTPKVGLTAPPDALAYAPGHTRSVLEHALARAKLDLSEVRGQGHAKRALVIAAAGLHSLLFIGPPGSGKSMLAQRLPGILPPLTESEALEVASIASVSSAGFSATQFGQRPFRSPHHSASAASLVGGGSRARPGEVSLAHHGVLFLDELPEFERRVLEVLREPLEAGVVSVARAAVQTQYPAAFQLIAAMNPCPCGRQGDPGSNCRCTPAEVLRYRAKVSAPLLDRIDMHVEVPHVELREFDDGAEQGETTASAITRVNHARSVQLTRQGICNARLPDSQVDRWCRPDKAGRGILERSMQRLGFSARARGRILKLSRTIADLEDCETVGASHVSQAVMLRCLDRATSQAT